MLRRKDPILSDKVVPLALGATAGLAAGLYFLGRAGRSYLRRHDGEDGLGNLEERIIDVLGKDPVMVERGVEVSALADGIVELSGAVRDEAEARLAVDLAQRVNGVHTVLNRLDLETEERHLRETRRRYDDGDPALHETHWYGLRVGIGTRRQNIETDPPRRDDRVDILERALGTDRSLAALSEDIAAVPNAVQGHST